MVSDQAAATDLPISARPLRNSLSSEGVVMATILVPIDASKASERVIPAVERLVQLTKADIVFLQVIDRSARNDTSEEARAAIMARLDSLCRELPYSARARVVKAATAVQGILEVAADEGADLVMLSSHGGAGARELPLGPVPRELLQSCGVPIIIVGPGVS